jgi:hypothetical protein
VNDDLDICPGRCNRAWEAAERREHETGEPHQLHPVPGQPIWCHDCRDQIQEALEELPREVAAVPSSGRLNTPATELGRLSRADVHASPSPAFDFHDEYRAWVRTNVRATAQRLGHNSTGQGIGYLISNLSNILSQDPEGIDFGMAAFTWRRRVTNAAGGPPLVHRIPGTCPHCDRRGLLRRSDGDDIVKCHACGSCWDIDHWRHLVRAVLAS